MPHIITELANQHGKSPIDLVVEVLNKTQSPAKAAEAMGVTRVTIYQWIKDFDIEVEKVYRAPTKNALLDGKS